jgi:ribosomal protein RSM22 (predicted rRNA methylase)
MDVPRDLREALDGVLSGVAVRDVAAAVDRLIERYRAGAPAEQPILTGAVDVLAYAAYRMPATYAAARSALAALRRAVPGLAPRRHLDLGGGTGAAAWAVVDAFDSVAEVTVLDGVPEALALGQKLGAHAAGAALRAATWRAEQLPAFVSPTVDLVTVCYVLGELTTADQADLVARAAAAVGPGPAAVVVVEPGTPAGYARILAARDGLLAAGLRLAAPCPHGRACPLAFAKDSTSGPLAGPPDRIQGVAKDSTSGPLAGPPDRIQGGRRDWCHFAARVNRSGLHRRLKGGELGYEDEKFSYVAGFAGTDDIAPMGRVLRHPLQRKGLVTLQVCTVDDGAGPELVSRRQGERYRAARDLAWGDPWPPAPLASSRRQPPAPLASSRRQPPAPLASSRRQPPAPR